jgi:hypothetical protein
MNIHIEPVEAMTEMSSVVGHHQVIGKGPSVFWPCANCFHATFDESGYFGDWNKLTARLSAADVPLRG